MGAAATFVAGAAAAREPRIQLADLRGSIVAADAGVVPGSEDDQSAALQRAILDAVAEDRALFLPAGRYEASNIELPSGARLIGIPGATRIVYSGGGRLLFARGARALTLDGIVLDGANRALADDAEALLRFEDTSDLAVTDCEIVGSSRSAMKFVGVSGRLAASRLSGARDYGLFALDSTGLAVVDNIVATCGEGGILIHRTDKGEDGTLISRNLVERIDARSGGTGQVGNGINVYRADGVVVSDNRVRDCAFSAIRANSGSNVQIVGNSCLRSGETGIYSEFEFEGALVANNIVDGASIGISIANFNEGGRLASVTGNILRNLVNEIPYEMEFGPNLGIGIWVEADAAVTGNAIDSAANTGIALGWGEFLRNVSATGNVIRGTRMGIGVTVVEGAGPAVIANNMISESAVGAICGMRWNEVVDAGLAADASKYGHLTVSGNAVG